MANENKVQNFTAEQEESINEGIEALFGVVGGKWGEGNTLGSFDAIDDTGRMAVLSRVYSVLDYRSKVDRERRSVATKTAIGNLVQETRASLAEAIEEIEAMSPAARAVAGVAVPTESRVPLARFEALFPAGTTAKEILDTLHACGLKLLAGRSKEGQLVTVPLKDREAPKPPTTNGSGSGLGK